ncbi:hypothetical protein AK830_g4682 [Neonectria ditissima]|uniref:Fe2OG dioxygenase domain-containing protein n=1 Tax=Neonectria ditissima TaxID=78410 RepID=A0A0P7BMQ5_9HYPO|nr:hypothetical protein AK830_g4682 [Neonectria ditissima]
MSDSDTEPFSDWHSGLVDCLDGIRTAGDFSWTATYNVFVNPGLEMDGYGQVPLPLSPRDAQAIKKACRPAPFGMGDQTLVDDSVRKTWELDCSQFRPANPRWQAFLDGNVLAAASQRLGLGAAVTAKPHKLLLYEPGSFFKPHKDSQKEPGMVGTLVVCLPSEHEGGDVQLSFKGEKRSYATGPASRFDLTALAWFGDVLHEVKKLTSGYRLVLTYNIVLPSNTSPLSASFFDAQTEKLQRILTDWQKTDRKAYRMYYLLDHQYSESSLSLGKLVGRDVAVCQLLNHVASASSFSVFLAHMTHHKERQEEEPYDDDEECTELRKIYTCDGQLIAQGLAVHPKEIPYPVLAYHDDAAADSEDEPEYLGNEDSPIRFRYHNTVVVLFATPMLHSLLNLDAGNVMVDALVSEVARDFKNRPDDDEAVACAVQVIKKCYENKKHQSSSTLPQMIQWSVTLNNDTLYEAAVAVGKYRPQVQQAIARLVEKEYTKCADPQSFEGQVWDKWLGTFVKDTDSITWLEQALSTFSSYLQDTQLKASFQSWKSATLTTQLETRPQLKDGDHDFVINAMSAHHNNTEWFTTSLLPHLRSRGTSSLLCRVLSTVFRSKDFASDETKAIFKLIAKDCKLTLALRTTNLKSGYPHSLVLSSFVSLIDQGLELGLADSVRNLLDKSRLRFQAGKFPDGAGPSVATLLSDLVRTLQKQSNLKATMVATLKAFFETALRKGLRNTAPVYPVEQLKGWAVPAQGCGDSSCSDCKDLGDFLLAEDRESIRFPLATTQTRHKHLEGFLYRKGVLDWETVWEGPMFSDTPRWFTVMKKKTMFQRDLDLFEPPMKALEDRMKPLKGDYLKKLLGEDGYRELVLLEGIRPGGDGAGEKGQQGEAGDGHVVGKRPAEEELGDAQKRHKAVR